MNHSRLTAGLYQRWVRNLSLLAKQTDAIERKDTTELLIDTWNEAKELKKQSPDDPFLKLILNRDIQQHLILSRCASHTVVS